MGSGQSPGGGPGEETPRGPAFYSTQKWVKNPCFSFELQKKNNFYLDHLIEFYSHGHCTIPPNQNVNWNSETSVGVFGEIEVTSASR